MNRIDLHAHTNHSDGSLTPFELVRLAHEVGLRALAVTDHDTTSGLEAAHAAGRELGVEILDGCEITALRPSGIVHILAYALDPTEPTFAGLIERVVRGRHERNLVILEKLAGLGMLLDYEEVSRHAVGAVVARPHFARALLERGHVSELRDAFRLYLRDGGPAYAHAPVPKPEVAIQAVVAAGGVAVLAHPRSLKLGTRFAYEKLLEDLVRAGLSGIEVDHPSQDPTQRATFRDLARQFDLVDTGGSDFHGEVKPDLVLGTGDGTIDVPYETWERLLERRNGTRGTSA